MLRTQALDECYVDLLGDLFLVLTDRENNRPKETKGTHLACLANELLAGTYTAEQFSSCQQDYSPLTYPQRREGAASQQSCFGSLL